MSKPSDDVLASLPAEVAALGMPEQVFAPAKRVAAPATRPFGVHIRTSLLIAGMGLLFWLCAVVFLGVLPVPGTPPPPPEIGLYAGAPCVLVGSGFLIWAAWLGMGGTRGHKTYLGMDLPTDLTLDPRKLRNPGTQTYLLYKRGLVEFCPDRHRIIPWEKVGIPQVSGLPGFVDYRVPVQGEESLRFDYTMPDHAELARAVTRQHYVGAVGGEAALASLSTAGAAPFFLAGGLGATYRISLLGKSLLFLRVGDGTTEDPDPLKEEKAVNEMTKFGLLGGLVVGFMAATAYPTVRSFRNFQAKMQRLEGASQRELFQAVAEQSAYPGSFLIPAERLVEVRFEAPTWWTRLKYAGAAKLLVLVHTPEGKTVVGIRAENLATAEAVLATVRARVASSAASK
jgi:hypothetical protein